VHPIYKVLAGSWNDTISASHRRNNIYLDEMEETEERAIVQGKLDYFLTNQTLQVPLIDTDAKEVSETPT
jgi:hypothetical protein